MAGGWDFLNPRSTGTPFQPPIQQTIGAYGAPPGAGGTPAPPPIDLSFLDPTSPNFNQTLYNQATGAGGVSQATGGAASIDANSLATAQRDASLQGQYGGVLAANNLYNQQTNQLTVQGINSAEKYGATSQQLQTAGVGLQAQEAQFQSAAQTRAQQSAAAANGATVTTGNRAALSDIQTQLQFTMKGLYDQLQQIQAAGVYRQESEYQQLEGVNNLAANQQANYAYQQTQNQTAIQDLLQPYAGLIPK